MGACDTPQGDINIDLKWEHAGRKIRKEIQVLADGNYLPFSDNVFSLVRSTHVLEHVPNPYLFLFESARVSRKYVFIQTPNVHNFRFWLRDSLDSAGDYLAAHRYQGFTERQLRQMFQFAGLKVLQRAFVPITDPYSGKYGPRKLDIFLKWMPRFNMREIQMLGVRT